MADVIGLSGIRKSFPGVVALDGVNLTLRGGTIHALVGENGAGKSTLINILSGILQPDAGSITLDGQHARFADARAAQRSGVVTVHQEVDLFPDLTVAENLALEKGLPRRGPGIIDWRQVRRQAESALHSLGETWSPSILASTLTPARRQLVEIAAAVSQSARVLILDEPTSSLSAAEVKVLFGHVRRFRDTGTAILYISHRLEEIYSLADEVTILRDGRNVWSGPLADCNRDRLINLMVGRAEAAIVPATARPATRPVRKVMLRSTDLTARDGSFTDVTLHVDEGEVLGLYGLIGAGRSEWAQGVFGLRPLAQGKLFVTGIEMQPESPETMVRHGVAYVPEDRLRQGLCRGLSVRANTVLASLRRLAWGLFTFASVERHRTLDCQQKLSIRCHSIEQPVGTLSGGNQQKVVLGRWLNCDPKVLILDEPTRGVDVGAKAEIHGQIRRLADEGRAIILISSELTEVKACSDRIGVFREGRLVRTFEAAAASAEDIAREAVPTGDARVHRPLAAGRLADRLFGWMHDGLLLFVVIGLLAILEGASGRLVSGGGLRGLTADAALLGFCALGAALVLLAGGLDISLGAIMALSAGIAGRLWEQQQPLPIVFGTAMAVGGMCGCLNATLSLVGRVHPIVVTLGTLSLFRGLTLWWIREDVHIPLRAREWLTTDTLGAPLIAWLGLALVTLLWFWLNWTRTGREAYAVGSNPAAARRVGIHRGWVWIRVFTIQGMLCGLAGILSLARSGSLQPTSYEDRTLQGIAAAVVGGIAITGGRGSVWGVALGCLFLVLLDPACQFLHVSTYWQRTVVGAIMLLAVLIDLVWRRRALGNQQI